jgi:hypothetical protein
MSLAGVEVADLGREPEFHLNVLGLGTATVMPLNSKS